MGKAIVTVAALGLMWLGYMAWPLYDLYALVNAFKNAMFRRWCDRSILTLSEGRSLTRSSLPMYSARAFNSAHDCKAWPPRPL